MERLWRLKIPSKIKIFGWRALKGFLLCKMILANRHIGESGDCPVCQQGVEDVKHLIFTCDRMKAVWRSMGLGGKIQQLTDIDRSGSSILEEIIINEDQIQAMQVGLAELVLTT